VARREQSFRASRRSSRNGERHPGSQDAVSLRGRAEKCESWPVRLVLQGLVPSRQTHRRQQVSSGRMRRGTSSACAKRTHSSRWRLRSASLTRTRPSLGPETRARQSSLNSGGASQRRWRVSRGIAVGQTHASGNEPATGPWSADECAARRVSPLFSFAGNRDPEEVVRDASEKEGGPGHRPCEETRVPSSVSVRRVSSCRSRQAASWPRISSYAALEKGWR
jgi:hypothetical protein